MGALLLDMPWKSVRVSSISEIQQPYVVTAHACLSERKSYDGELFTRAILEADANSFFFSCNRPAFVYTSSLSWLTDSCAYIHHKSWSDREFISQSSFIGFTSVQGIETPNHLPGQSLHATCRSPSA